MRVSETVGHIQLRRATPRELGGRGVDSRGEEGEKSEEPRHS